MPTSRRRTPLPTWSGSDSSTTPRRSSAMERSPSRCLPSPGPHCPLPRVAALALACLLLAGCSAGPRSVEIAGDTAVHDPALVVGTDGDPWFVYSTGGAPAD